MKYNSGNMLRKMNETKKRKYATSLNLNMEGVSNGLNTPVRETVTAKYIP